MVQNLRQTDRQTEGHGDSMTESAKRSRFSENHPVEAGEPFEK